VARWAPLVVGGLVAAAGVLLVTRPWWSVARQSPDDPSVRSLENLQRQQHLSVDGTHTYAENSVTWVSWYLGPVVPVLGWAALVAGAARATRWWLGTRRLPSDVGGVRRAGWLVPAAVGLGSTVLTLYRPGITPDHPWADRRLVVTVLPTIVLAALAAVAWTVRTARRRAPASVFALAGVFGVAVLLVPPAASTGPVALTATERGEPAAADAVCAALQPQDVVVALGSGNKDGGPDRATNEWPQLVRGVCGRPAGSLLTPPDGLAAALDRLGTLVRGARGRLVVLAAVNGTGSPPRVFARLGLHPARAVRLLTTEDPHWLARPAAETWPLLVEVWTAPWPAPATGAAGR
jgi:hypothetical protein